MNYGELRYDPDPLTPDPASRATTSPWTMSRGTRSCGAAPRRTPACRSAGRPSGPQRRVEAPGFPATASSPVSRRPRIGRPAYGQPRGDWGGCKPAGPADERRAGDRPGSRPGGSQPGPAFPPGPTAQGTGFLSAPTGPVGLLTPPDGTRVDDLRDGAAPAAPAASPGARAGSAAVLTAPSASRPRTGTVRPGHGLDGPEITSSWPVQPEADDLDSFQDFWRDDEDEEYTGLFGDRHAEFDRADARQAAATKQVTAKRRIGRRRGGSNDRRLWLGLGGVVIVAAAAITGIIKFEFPSHGGPAHTMVTPAKIGTYARTVDLERQARRVQAAQRGHPDEFGPGQRRGVGGLRVG